MTYYTGKLVCVMIYAITYKLLESIIVFMKLLTAKLY